jgi:DNA polymerase bacteriophage-type
MNARAKQWRRIPTWHGLLVENVVQAGANDILRVGLTRAEDNGMDTVLHIHDEIVVEEVDERAQDGLRQLIGLMTRQIEWAPGLPLAAAGYVAKRYRKE